MSEEKQVTQEVEQEEQEERELKHPTLFRVFTLNEQGYYASPTGLRAEDYVLELLEKGYVSAQHLHMNDDGVCRLSVTSHYAPVAAAQIPAMQEYKGTQKTDKEVVQNQLANMDTQTGI